MRLIGFCYAVITTCLFPLALSAQDIPNDKGRLDQDSLAAALEMQIAKELGVEQDSIPTVARGSLRGLGGTTNPKISVIGSFLGSGTSDRATTKRVNLGLNEAEVSFQSYVDPYAKADFFVSFGRETEDPFSGPDSALSASSEYGVDLEEAYLTTLFLPFSLQARLGKFRSHFGKINGIHPHALGYADMPRMIVNYFGEEGLNDQGIGLNWLVPNPLNFYQELSVEITSGSLDAPSFSGGSQSLLTLGHLKNFFDLSDNTTLELGVSGIRGANDASGHQTTIGGVDLTLKWKPLRENRYRSFEWTTEGLMSHRRQSTLVKSKALYSYMNYQLTKRWFLGGRFDYSEFPDDRHSNEKAYSAILGFLATEFQKLEIQFQRGDPAVGSNFNRVLLRAIFVIGAHGAHQY